MPSEVTDLTKGVKTGLLEGEGVAAIARAAATTTAMSHFTDTARASPSALLKAAEWYSYAWNLCWPVAAYRKLRYGTIDTGSFDMLEITSDTKAAAQLRDQLYEQMCNNFFRFAAAGPGSAKRYLDGLVTQTAGQHTALMQFFYAVNCANTAVQDAIDRFRRRVYAIRVTSEVAMVVLGAGPIALGVQIGVGLGYSLITNVITQWSGMEQADIVAMPARFAASNVSSVGFNVAQQMVDDKAKADVIFEQARQRAFISQQAEIEQKIAKAIERGKKIGKLTAQKAAIAERAVRTAAQTELGVTTSRLLIRKAGIGVGLLFMREAIENVLTFIWDGDL